MTQNAKVLKHMIEYGSITPAEAVNRYGIYRLAARIHDLRHRYGYRIVSKTESKLNRDGETCNYSRYFLKVGEDE